MVSIGEATYRRRNRNQINIRGNIQRDCNIDIDLGYGRLAVIARVRVDLPVLLDRVAAEEDGADDGDVGGADEGVCDFDAEVHVYQAGPVYRWIDWLVELDFWMDGRAWTWTYA
jgi:hypothetical protein